MYADDKSVPSRSENPMQLLEDLKKELKRDHGLAKAKKTKPKRSYMCEYMLLGNNKLSSKICGNAHIKIDNDEINR